MNSNNLRWDEKKKSLAKETFKSEVFFVSVSEAVI